MCEGELRRLKIRRYVRAVNVLYMCKKERIQLGKF